ncbi:MAG TPA: carbohydrate kinase [Jiangellaceae bacterium]|nr:carbohydrate kinase [Jiangellaceae bacterium]
MIVVAGEAVVDLVGEPDGRYRAVPGGSPSNVAVGLARLGMTTELLARLGTGRFGQLLRDHLTGNHVGLSHAVVANQPATLAVVSLDQAGRATYDFYVEGTADWAWTPAELPDPLPRGTVALCTGSLAIALEPGGTAITDLIRREHQRGEVTVVLDPNVRPALLGHHRAVRDRLESQLAYADVVKVSDEDLAWLAPGETIQDVAAHWLGLGPSMVVVTLGPRGAYAATRRGREINVAARQVDLVDTVGAGDAFTAGLVDALQQRRLLGGTSVRDRLATLDDATMHEIVDRAGLVAAVTCGRQGADPPTAGDLAVLGDGPADLRVGEQ